MPPSSLPLRTFAAAMPAFSIALLLDMPRPYWAMASVYITANLFHRGDLLESRLSHSGNADRRGSDDLLGPANLVNAPKLLSLAIALWSAFVLLSLIDGTPRSYVFMLAGYNRGAARFPIVSVPQSAFDIVVAACRKSHSELSARASLPWSSCHGASPLRSPRKRMPGSPLHAGLA